MQAPVQRIVFELARINIRPPDDARLPTHAQIALARWRFFLRGAHGVKIGQTAPGAWCRAGRSQIRHG
jgi:hypothetical protein